MGNASSKNRTIEHKEYSKQDRYLLSEIWRQDLKIVEIGPSEKLVSSSRTLQDLVSTETGPPYVKTGIGPHRM
jgi:hypothetical protein